jgi:hypothetical protein
VLKCADLRAAVVGWQWLRYRWIEQIEAVILVLVTYHGCGCGGGWVAVELGQFIKCLFLLLRVQGARVRAAVVGWQ